MSTITDWGEAFLTAITDAFRKIFGFLPDLIGALLILWIGWIVAGFLGKLVANVLRKIRFNDATERAGFSNFIKSAGIRQDAAGVMGEIVKWFFRVIALVAAFSVLQLPALTAALTGILNFIPNLAIALVIVLVGGLLANFISDLVKGAARTAGFSNSNLVGNIARVAILYVTFIAALGQLGIAPVVINALFIGTVAALALALGLAFGLGGRDIASRIWENTYNSAQENLPRLNEGLRQQARQLKQEARQAQQNTQGYAQPATQGYYAQQGYNAQGQSGYTGTGYTNQPATGYPTAPSSGSQGTYSNPSGGSGSYAAPNNPATPPVNPGPYSNDPNYNPYPPSNNPNTYDQDYRQS